LADSEEKCKDLHIKLRAKDDEMMRLQAGYREMEGEVAKMSNIIHKENIELENCDTDITEEIVASDPGAACIVTPDNHDLECPNSKFNLNRANNYIPKEDAMVKLQERFLKIMDEVADLSDEKHRLEHIILQLQTETDTICEYVALYQQQRNLLKKRDEDRGTQIKLFQIECDRLKSQLEELSGILLRFAEDKDLSTYFQESSKQKDMEKVRSLLLNLKSNTLVDPKRNNLELSNVYPCNCCSGKLIEV
jgi:golgin subfamily A member 2